MTEQPLEGADTADDDLRRQAVRSLEGSFMELMTEFRRFYAKAAETASPGMLPGTFKVLSVVNRHGPVTLSSLAERLTADKGMISRQVSELESLGMVERTAAPNDGRVRLISSTEFGAERLAAARKPFENTLVSGLEDWPLSSIERLTELLHALATGQTPEP